MSKNTALGSIIIVAIVTSLSVAYYSGNLQSFFSRAATQKTTKIPRGLQQQDNQYKELELVVTKTLDSIQESESKLAAVGGNKENLSFEDRSWVLWDWEAGIALIGLMKAEEAFRKVDPTFADIIINRVDNWMRKRIVTEKIPLNPVSSYVDPDCAKEDWVDYFKKRPEVGGKMYRHPNHLAPSLALLKLYQYKPTNEYRLALQQSIRFAIEGVCRVESRVGTVALHSYNQVWDDTLAMVAPFLSGYGKRFLQPKYIDRAYDELVYHAQLLQANKNGQATGAWFHGCDLGTTPKGPCDYRQGAYWTRGNAWAIFAATEIIDDMPDGSSKQNAKTTILRPLLFHYASSAIVRSDGVYNTLTNSAVINDQSNYPEYSGSSGVVYGLLKAKSTFPSDRDLYTVGKKGQKKLCAEVVRQADGIVPKVSIGTGFPPPADTIRRYFDIAYGTIKPYGQGLFMIMASVEDCT